jgi:hypothetical protein
MKLHVFWDITEHQLVNSYQYFKRRLSLHFQNQAVQEEALLGLLCPEDGGTMVPQYINNNSPLQMV